MGKSLDEWKPGDPMINEWDYWQDPNYKAPDPEKEKLVLRLATLITDRMVKKLTHKINNRDPEYWMLDMILSNLICPAEFDTGAHRNVMILSLPEGDDKPLKYPLMFQKSDALIITKMDAAPYFDFHLDEAIRRARALNPGIAVFPLSARTGEGMDAWEKWLLDERMRWRNA